MRCRQVSAVLVEPPDGAVHAGVTFGPRGAFRNSRACFTLLCTAIKLLSQGAVQVSSCRWV